MIGLSFLKKPASPAKRAFFRSGEKPSIIAADDPLRSLDNESLRAALVSFCFGRRRRRGASGSVPREDRVGDPAADAHARAKRPGEKNGYEGDAFTLHDESQTLSFMKKSAAEPKLCGEPNPQKKLNP